MARQAQGWKLRRPRGSNCYSVRFWDSRRKRQVEFGTGEQDTHRAAARAAQIYAEAIRGDLKQSRRRPCVAPHLSSLEASAKWLQESTGMLDKGTIGSYSLYWQTHLAPAFPSLLDVSPGSVRSYIARRLQVVQASTVRHELSALRGLLRWAVDTDLLSEVPTVPGVPKRAQGQAYAKRRRSKPDELSPREIKRLLDALPESTARLGAVRARFVLGYEMALRPSLLDRLSVPEHWRPGSHYLELPAGVMKARKASRKPLSRAALLALESCAPESGLVFGAHDYRDVVRAAAAKALPPEKAKRFTAAHLRSAGITHFLERGAKLTQAQALADHKYASTTDRYVRASERGLEQELKRQRRA